MQRYSVVYKLRDSSLEEVEQEFASFFDLAKFVSSIDESMVEHFAAYFNNKIIANDFIDMTYIVRRYLHENALAATFS